MKQTEADTLKKAVGRHWPEPPDAKAIRYVGKFFDRIRIGKKVIARVEGNHGIYTTSFEVKGLAVHATCSCYIGGDGHCHHCRALGATFLNNPDSFNVIREKRLEDIRTVQDLSHYLKGVTLDSLLGELKARGITQKEFAESIGMNPRYLSSIKSSELRNRYYNELGATKLACLWVLEHCKKAD